MAAFSPVIRQYLKSLPENPEESSVVTLMMPNFEPPEVKDLINNIYEEFSETAKRKKRNFLCDTEWASFLGLLSKKSSTKHKVTEVKQEEKPILGGTDDLVDDLDMIEEQTYLEETEINMKLQLKEEEELSDGELGSKNDDDADFEPNWSPKNGSSESEDEDDKPLKAVIKNKSSKRKYARTNNKMSSEDSSDFEYGTRRRKRFCPNLRRGKQKKKGRLGELKGEKWRFIRKEIEKFSDSSEDENEDPCFEKVYKHFCPPRKNTVSIYHRALTDGHVQFNSVKRDSAIKYLRKFYRQLMFINDPDNLVKCLLGVKKRSGNDYECKPFACMGMEKKFGLGQMDKVFEMIAEKYGLSMSNFYMPEKILMNLKMSGKSEQWLDNYLEKSHKPWSIEELRKAKEDREKELIQFETVQTKSVNQTIQTEMDIRLVLNKDLNLSDFEEVLLYTFHKKTNANHCLMVNFKDPESWTFLMADFWFGGLINYMCSRTIRKKFLHYVKLTKLPGVLSSLLQRKLDGSIDHNICPHCGKKFSLKTYQEKHAFKVHMKNHEILKTRCECKGVLFDSVKGRLDHMNLEHGDGTYSRCDICQKVFKTTLMESHKENYHKTFVCHTCGFTTTDKHTSSEHQKNYHSPWKCEVCNELILGKLAFINHKFDVHKISLKCGQCPLEFKTEQLLRKHTQNKHLKEEDKKFQCQYCEKGFTEPRKLRFHIINVHLKTRPFKCRLGCKMDYNDPSNRRTHERKVHKSTASDFPVVSEEEVKNILDKIPVKLTKKY